MKYKFLKKANLGFSIAELSVVMFLTTIITAVLVMFYAQSRLTLQRGVQKTALQQKVRLASIRVIPKIASTFSIPPNPVTGDTRLLPIVWPHPVPFQGYVPVANNDDRPNYQAANVPGPDTYDPIRDVGENMIMLVTTEEFALKQLRMPFDPVTDAFNPREPRYARLELFFTKDDRPHPLTTGTGPNDDDFGTVGDLFMQGYFDTDDDGSFDDEVPTNPPLPIAIGLTDVSFLLYPGNERVRLRVEARDNIPNATSNGQGELTVGREIYETDIFLPVYTSSGG